jgi:putative CocE/NonD family hydrolase
MAVRVPALLALMAGAAVLALPAQAPAQEYNETPATLRPVTDSFDYERRDVMIPMRDGVHLHTVILVPRGARRAPILLTRTPYNADEQTSHNPSSRMESALAGYDNPADVVVEGGYIRAIQDVRGKYGSEGTYVMNRPLAGTPFNSTKVDDSTDAYDTIDWLVKNIPETNGRVGILGISYDGYTPLMALINPHPALKVAIPQHPMVDGWMGDDWFHNGAFRQQNMPYIYEQEGTRANTAKWWIDTTDDYDLYMRSGSAGELGRRRGLDQMGFWRRVVEHPNYDSFWQSQALDKILARQPLKVPMLLVHGLWDAEDIYGDIAVYKALKPKDVNNDMVYLTIGPWNHGQEIEEAGSLGALKFGQDTALWWRRKVLAPFLAHYLKDDAPPMEVAPVTAFQSGTNEWLRLRSWPSTCGDPRCAPVPTPLYLEPNGSLGFRATAGRPQFAEYVSDPNKPVPNRPRPVPTAGYDTCEQWACWLVDDQRNPSGRPDVLVFTSPVLTQPVTISGEPVVHLTASTSGTDSDWVVKLIDVYPDVYTSNPKMGGYQLPVAMDIFRGRYRESFANPKPLRPNAPLAYRFGLPTANHVFLPGHRIMVQVQSSWFPLYDRNPQKFVPNIFWAKPDDFQKATQRVFVAGKQQSFVELPVVPAPGAPPLQAAGPWHTAAAQ